MANALYFTTINGQPVQLTSVQHDHTPVKNYAGHVRGTDAIPSESGKVYVGKKSYERLKLREFVYRFVGKTPDGKVYEADRVIFRKANPSNHQCDARCRRAKGGNCECSCGGKYHGAGG